MSIYKYYIQNKEFEPINTGEFTFTIELQRDSGSYQYVRNIDGKVRFQNQAYTFIRLHGDCQKLTFRVDEICEKGIFTIYNGFFTKRDCEDDEDYKTIEFTPTQDTFYDCVLRNIDKKFNFLQTPNPVTATYEDTPRYDFECLLELFFINLPFYGPAIEVFPGGVSPFLGVGAFVRELRTTYCQGGEPQPPEGADWELYINNCAGKGTATYWRKPPVFVGPPLLLNTNFAVTGCVGIPCTPPVPPVTAANEDWLLMDTITDGVTGIFGYWIDYNAVRGETTELNNGRLLVDVINQALNEIGCPELDVQSDSLTNIVNPITGQTPSDLEGLQLHAISDIKEPTADIPASREDLTLKDIAEGILEGKLNFFWFVDEQTRRFRIEHISFLSNGATFDLTPFQNSKKFAYDNTDIPKNEEFPSLDQSIDFTGVDIVYDNPCSENNKVYITDKVYSEVETIIGDPDSYPQDGVVLIAPRSLTPLSDNAENGAITGDYRANMAVSMANLHDKYWKFYRPFDNGEMNFEPEAFAQPRPVKVPSVSIPNVEVCCWALFNPFDIFVGLNFTDGQLQKAVLDPKTGKVTIDVKYKN